MKLKKQLRLSQESTMKVLRDLEVLVVSPDRLGSKYHDDIGRLASGTNRFLTDVRVFRKLAGIRQMLFNAIDSQFTQKEINKIERSLEKMRAWPSHKKLSGAIMVGRKR